MLSLISLGRSVWAKLQAAHPVIRWGGAILLGLTVLEFVAQETISLYVHMQTARATIEKTNADAARAVQDEQISEIQNKAIHATLPEGAIDSALTGKPMKK